MQYSSFSLANSPNDTQADRASLPQQACDQQLQTGGRWQPDEGPLLVVSTHPRDEILAAGGLIHTWVSLGQEVTVLSVTDGEADKLDSNHIDLTRRDELRSALRKLCAIHVSVVRLGLRDGHVIAHRNRLRLAIDALLEPRMTLVAPIEHDGHPDHETVGRVCREAGLTRAVPVARYLPGTGQSLSICPQGTRWGKFTLDMEARRAKAHALQCFKSHREPQTVPAIGPSLRSFEAFLV